MFFLDTNVLLYLFSDDTKKADLVEDLLSTGAIINVQVLNEFTSVAMRKLGMTVAEVRDALTPITLICKVLPLTTKIHQRGLQVAERYQFSFYDALIVAAALEARCTRLCTEDLQHGQMIENTLTVVNPFRA